MPPSLLANPQKTTVCAVCLLQPAKYTCPACSTRTCSLPCSVRHKAWKSCSGVRSPSAYLPRAALATPASLDHDFNFLSGLDREIERREDRIAEKGIKLADGVAQRGASAGWGGGGKRKGAQKVEERCRELGIRVIRAPAGLQRSRETRTQWDGGKSSISWCVEWMENEGRTVTVLSELLTIGDGWARVVEEKRKGQKKRKRGEDESLPGEVNRSFYLHLPRPSPKAESKLGTKALLRLNDNTTLGVCLKKKVIVEYPTIYVFSGPSGEVPGGFLVLEEEQEDAKTLDPTRPSPAPNEPSISSDHGNDEHTNSSSDKTGGNQQKMNQLKSENEPRGFLENDHDSRVSSRQDGNQNIEVSNIERESKGPSILQDAGQHPEASPVEEGKDREASVSCPAKEDE